VDRLKSAARGAGLDVQMGKDTVDLKPTQGFDAEKLYAISRKGA